MPDMITMKRVLIDGKETGIDHPGWISGEFAKLAAENDIAVTDDILKKVKQFNHMPTKDRPRRDRLPAALKIWEEKP